MAPAEVVDKDESDFYAQLAIRAIIVDAILAVLVLAHSVRVDT